MTSGAEPASAAATQPVSVGLRALTHTAAVWIGLALTSLLLGWVLGGTTLQATLLPAYERHALVARELVLLALPVIGLAGPLSLVGYGIAQRRQRSSRAGLALITLAALPALFLYAASWTTFHSTGRFLDSAGLRFMAANPFQFFEHVAHIEPFLLPTAPLLPVVGALALVGGVASALLRMSRRGHWILIVLAGLSLLGSCSVAVRGVSDEFPAGQFVSDPNAGMVYTYIDLYWDCRDDRAGPISHAWSDATRQLLRGEGKLRADPAIAVLNRPIVSLDEFIQRIDIERVRHWNVILVIVESLRTDQLVALGGQREVMPVVESLAREGLAFPDHYTQASHSNYADTVPLSSHYPLRSLRVHLYPENPTYPRVLLYDILRSLGWHTAIISSQNERWGQMINYFKTGGLEHFFHSESFDGPTYVPRNDTGFESFLKGDKRSGKIDDRFTVDEATRWIESLKDEAPFFLYLNLQNSHLPYETPADFPRRFGPAQLGFAIKFGGFPPSQAETVKNVYADSLAYSDYQIGRLVEFLKQRGQWDRTLVVVTGDTGQAFYEHGFVAHANRIYDELMRVPLVIRAPGVAPALDTRPAQHLDVAPTVLELLGIPVHPSFQGVSLIAEEPDLMRSRFLMVQAPLAHQYGVVRDGFKLVHDVERNKTTLVNLRKDPGETRNLMDRRPLLAEELRRRVDSWRKHQLDYYRDPSLHTKVYPPVLLD